MGCGADTEKSAARSEGKKAPETVTLLPHSVPAQLAGKMTVAAANRPRVAVRE